MGADIARKTAMTIANSAAVFVKRLTLASGASCGTRLRHTGSDPQNSGTTLPGAGMLTAGQIVTFASWFGDGSLVVISMPTPVIYLVLTLICSGC